MKVIWSRWDSNPAESWSS